MDFKTWPVLIYVAAVQKRKNELNFNLMFSPDSTRSVLIDTLQTMVFGLKVRMSFSPVLG